jgi:AbrB family looped-hinge helix DNA binding protein
MTDQHQRTRIVRPLRGGQITIPAEFRKRLGITEESLLQITLDGDELRLKPARATATAAGSPWLKELYDLFAPARAAAANYSEEEVNADIDEAVAEVRAAHANRRL